MGGIKRRNPFLDNVSAANDIDKRKRLSDNYFHANSPEVRSNPSQFGASVKSFDRYSSVNDENVDVNIKQNDDEHIPLTELPVDWSLKNRLSFVSKTPWKWGEHLSSVQVASSVTSSVRCLDISKGKHCLDTSATTQFYSNTYYWQFPTLPGVALFPRYKQSRLEKIALSSELHRASSSEWINSLQSIYQLVKAGQCPYFYVCSQLFTCLFRAAGIAGSQQMLALMTPTTSGIRAALTRTEVEFTMPLRRNVKDDKNLEVNDEEEVHDDCSEVVAGRGDGVDILESLGIEADSLQGFATNAATKKSSVQNTVVLDGRSDSLVFIEGVECQSLLNYLLNAKLSQGPNELPPTILAPVAFPGATLKSLKVREHTVGGKAGIPKSYQIDVTGPILPETLQKLSLLSANYSKDFIVKTRTQEDTFSFTAFTLPEEISAQAAFASANLNDCGLSDKMLHKLSKVQKSTHEKVIREIQIIDDTYKVISDEQK